MLQNFVVVVLATARVAGEFLPFGSGYLPLLCVRLIRRNRGVVLAVVLSSVLAAVRVVPFLRRNLPLREPFVAL